MLVLRVRCVDDGRELLVERHGADEHSILVADLKQLVLQQRQRLHPNEVDLDGCFVLLRGQILADPDVVDLNALGPSDVFVFAIDSPQSRGGSGSGSKMQSGDTFEVLRSQLVAMGFSSELAAQALRQSGDNLLDAAALLAEGRVGPVKDETLEARYPSIRSFVQDERALKLRELAATDSFQALTLLKEQFSSEMLNQLNENPVATLRLLSLPAPSVLTTEQEEVIDVDADSAEWRDTGGGGAIDRLAELGFARDLVEVMYESCGGDEQATANALLQTLES
ncbi:hypothetical protein PF005_g4214 [Phytophthora fragariae]|uniref:UBA domain-containing protein n=1 Tax=Phytophthora fragariae TaxID=53985 RepID=A0A6A4ENJ7_9STRA|nr:hypothetical protein PF003_g23442 [Phytophthora fragariae]KAE8945733.1 hypothetical protein PF009_g4636 [Phytophthora fragariae]KAE9023463.1 hypothetical protein PF011_g3968 [Phytophthora fragariae]KAE9129521.1 hypothetical protein PF010_g4151 [Phytophthora fragariae]KAE9133683.1 hypothetical protein PF007_g3236 [Phytophthora fragariae]